MPGRPKKPSLTDKQRRFIDEYQKDWNLVDAVLRAGYEAARRSSASLIGQNLLKQPLVKAAIEEKRRKLAAKADITAERTLEEIRRVAFFDFRKLFNPDGSLKNPEDMDDETASVVSSVEVFEEYEGKGESRKLIGYTKKVRLWDKIRALENLGKNLGLFREITEHHGSIDHNHKVDSRLLVLLDALPLEVREQMLEKLKGGQVKQLEHKSDVISNPLP